MIQCLDERRADSVTDADVDDERAVDEDPTIRCAACEALVAHARHRSSRDGKHIHVFTNPHGFTFRIACFEEAAGAAPTGPSSDEWAWFAGCSWRTGLCRECLTHLGWYFESESSGFWGLITARLI